jgi:hypothetical protein
MCLAYSSRVDNSFRSIFTFFCLLGSRKEDEEEVALPGSSCLSVKYYSYLVQRDIKNAIRGLQARHTRLVAIPVWQNAAEQKLTP